MLPKLRAQSCYQTVWWLVLARLFAEGSGEVLKLVVLTAVLADDPSDGGQSGPKLRPPLVQRSGVPHACPSLGVFYLLGKLGVPNRWAPTRVPEHLAVFDERRFIPRRGRSNLIQNTPRR